MGRWLRRTLERTIGFVSSLNQRPRMPDIAGLDLEARDDGMRFLFAHLRLTSSWCGRATSVVPSVATVWARRTA